MKQAIIKIIGVLLVACMVVLAVFAVIVHQETSNLGTEEMLGRSYLLSDDEIAAMQLNYQETAAAKTEFPEGMLIAAEKTESITLNIDSAGSYNLVAVYSSPEQNLFENPVDFTVNEYEFTSELSFLWADDITDIQTDRYGNEILPDQYQMPYAASYLEDHQAFFRPAAGVQFNGR